VAEQLEFYFDFSSPYGYLASFRIDDIAAKHGRSVTWRPYLLGAVFPVSGMKPLVQIPLKNTYSLHDLNRVSRLYNIPFQLPDPFPIPTQAAGRVFYFLDDSDPELAKIFAKAAMTAYFAENVDIRTRETVADIAAKAGGDHEACLAAINDPVYKDRLKNETQTGIDRGAFGSPFVFVDGEPFWGNDRLEMIDAWLERGGW